MPVRTLKFVFASFLTFALVLCLVPLFAFASDLPPGDFAASILETVKSFGGMPWMAKVAAICTLIVGSMKVSALRGLIWDRLGMAKVFLAPLLALVGGILTVPNLSLKEALAYLFAGGGAIILHELLDAIKGIPGLGNAYVAVIDFLKSVLGAEASESK